MKKLFIISILLVLVSVMLYSAIGSADFSADARQGWAWYFNKPAAYANWEADLILYLEKQGLELNKQRLESSVARKAQLDAIREALRGATDDQLSTIKTALGLSAMKAEHL